MPHIVVDSEVIPLGADHREVWKSRMAARLAAGAD
jgi:hypothetical protein